jgi:hypothetical protein
MSPAGLSPRLVGSRGRLRDRRIPSIPAAGVARGPACVGPVLHLVVRPRHPGRRSGASGRVGHQPPLGRDRGHGAGLSRIHRGHPLSLLPATDAGPQLAFPDHRRGPQHHRGFELTFLFPSSTLTENLLRGLLQLIPAPLALTARLPPAGVRRRLRVSGIESSAARSSVRPLPFPESSLRTEVSLGAQEPPYEVVSWAKPASERMLNTATLVRRVADGQSGGATPGLIPNPEVKPTGDPRSTEVRESTGNAESCRPPPRI